MVENHESCNSKEVELVEVLDLLAEASEEMFPMICMILSLPSRISTDMSLQLNQLIQSSSKRTHSMSETQG
jgi:hypothetical protein